ncbi:MAG: hypothetical protein K8L97_30645 [Anaerolineae bacterium]|nr:hypothetical protein [Anaerolineae bacterium]
MVEYKTLDTPQVKGRFDPEDGILYVSYHGVLTPDVTRAVYGWMGELIAQAGGDISLARGSVYDFRDVTDFDAHNLTSVQRQSAQVQDQANLQNHPVALVVDTMKQEQFVKLFMKLTAQEDRKRIVHSVEGALQFIKLFLARVKQGEETR